MNDFLSSYPGVDLRIIMLNDPHEISVRTADLFLTSEALSPGYAAKRLFQEQLVPVASTAGPEDFAAPVRLISAEADVGIAGRAWEAFANLNGLDMAAIRSGNWLCCSHYILAQEMALNGMGVALLPDFVVARPVAEGRLRRLAGHPLPTGQWYEIHVPIGRRNEPGIASFSAWVMSECVTATT